MMRLDKHPLFLLVKGLLAKKIVVFSLLALFLSSNTAFATNWVYLQRLEGTRYGACTEYLDTDSVVKDDDKLTYWTIWVIDQEDRFHDIGKIMWKKEAPLTPPLRQRNLERYFYNHEDVETNRYLKPMDFYAESRDEINRAMQYAGEGKGSDVAQPDHTVTPTPRWYGYAEFKDCNLYWDIHSIAVWPRDNPATVEITVKWVWNKKGLDKRKAYLMAKRPDRDGYENLSYTLVNYQFSTTENKMMILSVADHDTNQARMSFFEGDGWQGIEQDSLGETAREIALNWIKGREEAGSN